MQTLCLAQLALLAADRDDWESRRGLRRAGARAGRALRPRSARDVRARVRGGGDGRARARGRVAEAQDALCHGRGLLAGLVDFAPWYDVEVRVTLARAALRLSDVAGARELLADATRHARRITDAGALGQWLRDAGAAGDAAVASPVGAPAALTTAELRILTFLPTHLSFREIAERLYVSANTVKTQAHAIYRKLDAASRSEAVTRAAELGLVEI